MARKEHFGDLFSFKNFGSGIDRPSQYALRKRVRFAGFLVDFDETGTIGKRYRRQDEIGTPFCITYDFDTLENDNCVTIRDRDTMQQERVSIDKLVEFLDEKTQL